MFPVICQIGPLTLYSYGLMMAIGVLVCAFFLGREAQSFGIDRDVVFDFLFWVVSSGIVGARLFYVLLNREYFFKFPLEIMMIQRGGLAWQGGLIVGVLVAIVFVKKKNYPPLKILDFVAPYIALGQSIGRVGCFLNGCCFGRPSVWGIYFPVHEAHLHPTQLYSTLGLFLVFLAVKKYRSTQEVGRGRVFVLYLLLAAGLRFIIEFFRADHEILVFGLSVYQTMCLGFVVVATLILKYSKRQKRSID